MKITTTSVKKIVKMFANWISNSCPSISFDDALQDLWIEVIKAEKRFDDDNPAVFTTFIFRHLKFRSINMLKEETIRLKYDTAYANESVDHYFLDDPINVYVNQLCKSLDPLSQKLLRTIVDPPQILLDLSCSPDRRINNRETIANWHLASYLKVSIKVVIRSKIRIQQIMEEVVLD